MTLFSISCVEFSSDPCWCKFVSSAFDDHCCVFMRVSSWWRGVSVHGVYAGGNCDPSLDGVVIQVSEHSHLSSPSLLWQAAQGRAFKLPPPEKSPSPAFTDFEKPTYSFGLGWLKISHWQFYSTYPTTHNLINEKVALIMWVYII